jgi:glycerophosphoryl diester phosphodiesterase
MKNKANKKSNFLLILLISYGLVAVFPRPQNFSQTNPLRVEKGALPLLIAHGGGNQEFPDNTLEAYYHAYSIDPEVMLETDVNLTKDGVIILSHDRSLDQKTNLINADIINTNYADLVANEVDFGYDNEISGANGYNISGEFKKYTNYLGEQVSPLDITYPDGITARHPEKFLVSTLESLITLFPENLINVEIKQTGDIGLAALDAVIQLMDTYAATHQTYQRIVLASFHEVVFDQMVTLEQSTHPALMFSPATNGVLSFYIMQTTLTSVFYQQRVAVFQLPVSQYGLSLSTDLLIQTAHLHNIAVHYWTINDADTMRTLIEKGVDGIMTDRPTLLQSILDEYR